MKYAKIKNCDVANGPGVRVSLFVSGCNHHCKNCFNKEAWDFNYGNDFTDKEENEIIQDLKPEYITGLRLWKRKSGFLFILSDKVSFHWRGV